MWSHCCRSNWPKPTNACLARKNLIDFGQFKTTFDVLHPSANAMNAEPWVTTEQVAQHLGIVKETVHRWREHKCLRHRH